MNLPVFLREVDKLSKEFTNEQLMNAIHEIARTLPENKRSEYLQILEQTGSSNYKNNNRMDEELQLEIKICKKNLEKINTGEYYLDSEYNEEWDDWYNSDADEIFFSDEMQLMGKGEKAIQLIHKCIDTEAYEEGEKLAEAVSTLEVIAEGDYQEYYGGVLDIRDLYEYHLLNSSPIELLQECLYLVYMGNELKHRAENMFRLIQNFRGYEVRLEEVLQMGNSDLPQFEQFLPLWIEYLGKQNGVGVNNLLEEAQALTGDEQEKLDIARKFSGTHPELYVRILEENLNSDDEQKMLNIGLEALEKVKDNGNVREQIALLTARYACALDNTGVSEYCWLEAFRSEPVVINYMRLRFLSQNWPDYEEKAILISKDSPKKERINYYTLMFWNGEFDQVMKSGMNVKEPLGWSFTFMKEGIAAFLLLLYQGKTLPAGLKAMREKFMYACEFKKDKFYVGTTSVSEDNDTELFWKLFNNWKDTGKVSGKEKTQWMKKMEYLITIRVDGIMEANRRNYYGECAAFIAAWGETLESLGEPNAKIRFMRKYKAKYPRRRAFIGELRNYGFYE